MICIAIKDQYDHIYQGEGRKQSKLLQAMQHFLSQVVMEDMDEVGKMFRHEPLTDVYTPKERDEYNRYLKTYSP